MATRYMKIEALDSPTDELGLDENDRVQWFFQLTTWKHHSTNFEGELVALLEAAGVGTYETDIFVGSKVTMPSDDGPYLTVLTNRGEFPTRTMNEQQPPASVRPGAQIVVRGTSYTASRAMIYDAWLALDGVYNQDVTAVSL